MILEPSADIFTFDAVRTYSDVVEYFVRVFLLEDAVYVIDFGLPPSNYVRGRLLHDLGFAGPVASVGLLFGLAPVPVNWREVLLAGFLGVCAGGLAVALGRRLMRRAFAAFSEARNAFPSGDAAAIGRLMAEHPKRSARITRDNVRWQTAGRGGTTIALRTGEEVHLLYFDATADENRARSRLDRVLGAVLVT